MLDGSGSPISGSDYDWIYHHQGLRLDHTGTLYDNRMRFYSPGMMRFMNSDPIKFRAGDPNLYRYEGSNSIGRLDPDGLDWMPSLGDKSLFVLSCKADVSLKDPDSISNDNPSDANWWATILRGKCATGGKYSVRGNPKSWFFPKCAGSLAELCVILKDSFSRHGGKRFDHIVLAGHCGGPNRPGVKLSDEVGGRFEPKTITQAEIDCIQSVLSETGTFVMCSCGYQSLMGQAAFAEDIKALAIKLQRRVCACPDKATPDRVNGCTCLTPRPGFEGEYIGTEAVCYPSKPWQPLPIK